MKNSSKGFIQIIALLVLVIVGIITLVIYGVHKLSAPPNIVPVITNSPTPTTSQLSTNSQTDWKIFESSELHFSLKYPSDKEVVASSNTIAGTTIFNLTYFGKFQGSDTGHVDGFEMQIEYSSLKQETLQSTANSVLQERISLLDGSTDNKEVKNVSIGNTQGYSGGDMLVLSAGNNGYLKILTLILDDHKVGYQKLLDQILSTLTVKP